jgi:anaerobic selenocysteine-containing dehydrogenase
LALRREDLFTVVLELFQMDTADFAGLVLPAARFLECHDLAAGYFHQSLSAQGKVMEPLGEALPNQEIFRRLAKGTREIEGTDAPCSRAPPAARRRICSTLP